MKLKRNRTDYDNYIVLTANINNARERKKLEQDVADNMSDKRSITYIQSQYKKKVNLTAIIRLNWQAESIDKEISKMYKKEHEKVVV